MFASAEPYVLDLWTGRRAASDLWTRHPDDVELALRSESFKLLGRAGYKASLSYLSMPNALSPGLESRLRRELTPGERIIWQGQPAPVSRAFAAAGHVLFGIPFVAFAVYWTRLATQGQESTGWLGYLWGGAFVLIGATSLLSPVAALWLARRTV